jgi:hypothetical protein
MPLETDLRECLLAMRRIQAFKCLHTASNKFWYCAMRNVRKEAVSGELFFFAHDFSVFPYTCGVASLQAQTPDLESLPSTIAQSARVRTVPGWLDGALGASNSSALLRSAIVRSVTYPLFSERICHYYESGLELSAFVSNSSWTTSTRMTVP